MLTFQWWPANQAPSEIHRHTLVCTRAQGSHGSGWIHPVVFVIHHSSTECHCNTTLTHTHTHTGSQRECFGVYGTCALQDQMLQTACKFSFCFNQNIFQVTTWKGNLRRRMSCSGEFAASSDSLSLSLIWFVISTNSHLLSCQSREPWLWLWDLLSHFAVSLGIWPASRFMNTTSVSKSSQLGPYN